MELRVKLLQNHPRVLLLANICYVCVNVYSALCIVIVNLLVVFYQLFEGLKAFYGEDGKVRIFRPDMNCKRLNQTADYACLPVSCVYKLMCMCIFVSMCPFAFSHCMYGYIRTCIYVCMRACTCTCTHIRTHTHTHTHTMLLYIALAVCICTCVFNMCASVTLCVCLSVCYWHKP